jgi:release factor glutamine methyltransferase
MSSVANIAAAAPATTGGALIELKELFRSKGIPDPERWAETAVAAVLDVPTAALAEHGAAPLIAEQTARLRQIAEEASPNAPVAYQVGRAPFLGRDFAVTRDTLIPKADTELFLRIVFAELQADPLPPDAYILELCCGSGCVAITVAAELPGSRVVATDISPEALVIARQNVAAYALQDRIALGQGDMFAPVSDLVHGRPFDLILSNPPYIPTEKIQDMGRFVADHEPHLALDGGEDGLDPHRRILDEARQYLRPGGRVFLEHEWYHGEAARALAAAIPGYTDIRTFPDANGKDRALYARYVG